MPYLLSLLGADTAIAGSQHHLCCYTNDTAHIQLIRETKAEECLWRRVVFPGERVLFSALPESVLEVRTPLHASVSPRRVDCQRLYVYADPKAVPVAVVGEPQSEPTPVLAAATVA